VIISWKIRVADSEYLKGHFYFEVQKSFTDERILIRDLVLLPQPYEHFQEFSELTYSARPLFDVFLRGLNGSYSISHESTVPPSQIIP